MDIWDSDEDDEAIYVPINQFSSILGLNQGVSGLSSLLQDVSPGARALPTLFPQPLPGLIKPENSSRRDWFQDTSSTSSDSDAIDVFSTYEDFINRFKERNREQFPSTENSNRNSRSPFAPEGRQVNRRHWFSGNKTDSSSDDDDAFISKFRNFAMQGGGSPRRNLKSTWCTDIEGNVRVAEICYYSVTGTCRYEDKGCYRLHAHQHYYWQVSNEDGHWYNLPLSWVNALEGKYTDPAQEQVSLPKMDEGECEVAIKRLLTLKRPNHWTANFNSMELGSSDLSKTYKLRRLCTEKISGQGIESSNFLWYFLDKNSKWVEYGRADTSGNQCMMSSITSRQIENHFLLNPNSSITFTASKFSYILDTKRMIQTNQRTGVVREVRRRPATYKKESSETANYFSFGMTKMKNYTNLPSFWDAMQPKQRACRVHLSSHSAEYKKVVGVLNGEISSSSISKVERIQNPCLWRAFQNKVDDMTLMYGDVDSVNIRQLFHGTQGNVVDNIINENFDWRLHGISRGQVHGQGTYFSTKASESYGYCKADPHGNKYLFIARVAVGTITRGDSTMTRPPINPETNAPYDSTGSGSIIVKYDKQEYYPEYILTLNG